MNDTSEEANMFRDCGEAGHYVNSLGNTQNLIIVDCKNGMIYSKESIPLGCKVYLIDETYLGLVVKCTMVNNSVGNIHEIELEDVPITKQEKGIGYSGYPEGFL